MSAPTPPPADQPATTQVPQSQAPADAAAEPAKPRRTPWHARTGGSGGAGSGGPDVARIRTVVGQVVWAVCALFALILAIAVLLIAIDANADNDLVRWLIARAADVDLHFFSLTDPIKDWDTDETNPAKDVKTALFNYGIAAIVWLVIGRIADRVIRPGK